MATHMVDSGTSESRGPNGGTGPYGPGEGGSPLAQALTWSSRITTVALEMVLPGAFGYWVDCQWGTGILFLVLGLGLGVTSAMFHLMKMVSNPGSGGRSGEGGADGGAGARPGQ